MSSVLRPRGPEKSSVYWRRRALAGLGGALVVVLLVVLVVAVRSRAGQAADATLPQTGGEVRACGAEDIKVSLVRFKREWPDQQQPGFTGTVMNSSDSPCSVDLATDAVLTIVSGTDRIFSSADCGTAAVSNLATIEPGQTQDTSVIWERVRSTTNCATGQQAPRPGTYRATWSVLGVDSDVAVFVLAQ